MALVKTQRRMAQKSNTGLSQKYLYGPILNFQPDVLSLGALYVNALNSQPEKIHQVEAQSGITETKGALRERAIIIANSMMTKGIRTGDKVIICSKCHLDMTATLIACLLCGVVILPLNSDMTIEELQLILSRVPAKMVFCDLRTITQLDKCLKKLAQSATFVLYGNEKRADTTLFRTFENSKIDQQQEETSIENKTMEEKPCVIFPSEGTTGSIQLCEVTEHALWVRANVWSNCFLQDTGKLLSYMPINSWMQITSICSIFETNITRILPGAFHSRNCCKLIHDLQIDTILLSRDHALELFQRYSGVYVNKFFFHFNSK